MPLGNATFNPNNVLTAGRTSRVVLDGTETVVLDDAWGGTRMYGQVGVTAARSGGNGGSLSFQSSHVRRWLSGCWTCEPLYGYVIQEKTLPAPVSYVAHNAGTPAPTGALLSATTVPAAAKQVWNQPALNGLAPQAGVATSGGNLFQRIVAAAESWTAHAAVLNAPAAVTGFSGVLAAPPVQLAGIAPVLTNPIPTNLTQPLTPIATSDGVADPDQGFTINWKVPGGIFRVPDVAGVFCFGGLANAGSGIPQYALSIHGDGTAHLCEYAAQTAGGALGWYFRFSFQYCQPSEVCGNVHEIVIFPHVSPEGARYISFITTCSSSDQVLTGAGSFGKLNLYPQQASAREWLYKYDPATAGTVDGSPGHATGAGKWWILERGDLRLLWGVNLLAWWPSGILVDDAWPLPVYESDGRLFESSYMRALPVVPAYDNLSNFAAPALSMAIVDPSSYTTVVNGPSALSVGAGNSVCVRFLFSSTLFRSAILWGYTLTLPATSQVVAPGAFTPPMIRASIRGAESDPRRESADVTIEDPANMAPRLATRGSFPVRIETDVLQSDGSTKTVVLHRGYTERPNGQKKGRTGRKTGLAGQGPTALYPSADWRHYDLACAGMWHRLSRVTIRTAMTLPVFRFDPNAPAGDPTTGVISAFKVTDVIPRLLSRAGFPNGMINIPDINFRLQPGIGVNPSDFVLDPNAGLADLIYKLSRNYLGAFLIFDPNAGAMVYDRNLTGTPAGAPIGQWTLLQAPPTGATPVYNFVTSVPQQATGATAMWHNANLPALTTFCMGGDLNGYTVPPEHNKLIVACAAKTDQGGVKLDNVAVNPHSYNVPGFTIRADPNSAHYIGYESPAVVWDPSLWGGDGSSGLLYTQTAIDFMIRRLFQFLCLPRRIQPITAPLICINDPMTSALRPLRFYDPVSYNGDASYYVRNVNPNFERDSVQLASYELEKVIPI